MISNFLIIGGSSGIGKKLVVDLLKDNNKLIVSSRQPINDPDIVDADHIIFNANEPKPLSLPVDRLDGLVYCPGTINLKPFHRIKPSAFEEEWKVNFMGAVHVIQESLSLLKKSSHASIVLFSTVAVQNGMSFHASIAAAKGAIEGLVRSLAAEFAPKIRVNCIAPSIVDTPLAGKLLSTPEKIAASGNRHPLQRVGEISDITAAVKFLLLKESSWMTGQIMAVDGGMSSIRPL